MKKISFLSLLLILGACELIIDIETPPFNKSLVINSIVNTDSTISAVISRDRYVLDNSIGNFGVEHIEDANVFLFENEIPIGQLTFQEEDDEFNFVNGYFKIDHVAFPGSTYRLDVSAPGFKNATVSTIIPDRTAGLRNLAIEEVPDEFGFTSYKITGILEDQVGEDFYEIQFFESWNNPIFNDQGEIIGTENVFSTMYVETDDLLFEDHLWDLLIFSDDLFEGRSYEIMVDTWVNDFSRYEDEFDIDPDHKIFIQVKSISEDYFNFFNTVALQNWTSGDPFSEPVQVFSNVENGFGIFAGYQTTWYQIDL